MNAEPVIYICLGCGRQRTARHCGCLGTRQDQERWARMAAIHREAAVLQPGSATEHLADAERLELLAGVRGAA